MKLTRHEHGQLVNALQFDDRIPEELLKKAKKHTPSCKQCQDLIRESVILKENFKALLKSAHPTIDELLEYITGTYCLDSSPKSSKFDVHLKECKLCHDRLSYYQNEIEKAESIFYQSAEKVTFEEKFIPQTELLFKTFNWGTILPRPAMAVAFALILSFYGIYNHATIPSLFSQPPHYEYAEVQTEEYANIIPNFRSAQISQDENTLNIAKNLLRAGEYKAGHNMLSQLDQEDLKHSDQLQAQLYNLMATLKLSERSFFGFSPSFDQDGVQNVIIQNEKFIASLKSHSGFESTISSTKNYGLLNYFLAKASLMTNETSKACEYFTKAQKIPGHPRHRRSKELQQLLKCE